jgi:hypothetical protein
MVQDDLGDFGDARLRRAGARLLEAMSEQPTMCVHALAKDRNVTLVFQGAARTRDQARMIAKEILLSGHVKGGRAVSWGSPWAEELGQNASLDLVAGTPGGRKARSCVERKRGLGAALCTCAMP